MFRRPQGTNTESRTPNGEETLMPKKRDPGPSVKDKELYEKLRDEGSSKQKAARIANTAAKTSRKTVGKRGGSSASYEDWTKADLYERAKQVGIEGRSSMSKAQLVKALRNS
jgi:hypothetical protein